MLSGMLKICAPDDQVVLSTWKRTVSTPGYDPWPMRISLQLSFAGFLSPSIMRTKRFASAILAALLLACSAPGLAESSPLKDVDAEVVALLQELRDQPEAKRLGCTPCAVASRQAHAAASVFTAGMLS
jgi:hypothetical protein